MLVGICVFGVNPLGDESFDRGLEILLGFLLEKSTEHEYTANEQWNLDISNTNYS